MPAAQLDPWLVFWSLRSKALSLQIVRADALLGFVKWKRPVIVYVLAASYPSSLLLQLLKIVVSEADIDDKHSLRCC